MLRPFQRVRHIRRYRQIAGTFIKFGFSDVAERAGPLRGLLSRRWRRQQRRAGAAYEDLSSAVRFRMALEELGPTFIKFGQILSTRPDVVPPDFIIELEKLQDKAAPVEWDLIRRCIETELGGPISQFFKFVETRALASASLAQVHAARLPDGTDVVLKVQRPHIEEQIAIDLEIFYDIARVAQSVTALGNIANTPTLVEDFAYTLKMEMDYSFEGQNAEIFRDNFANNENIYIPRVYWNLTTTRLLVMERLRGIKIDDTKRLDASGYDRHQLALNAAQLIVQSVLEDGFFHADPHPGNLFVLEGGRIGAVDFGMVGWLDVSLRNQLSRLYVVTIRQDINSVVDLLIELGVASYTVNRRQLSHDLSRLLRKYYGRPLKDMQAQTFVQDITPIIYDHRLQLPTDLWLLIKTLVMLEGLGRQLDPEFDIFEASKPYVGQIAASMWSPERVRSVFAQTTTSAADLLIATPDILLKLLRRIEQGELKVQAQLAGLDELFDRIDSITNRVIITVLLAANILGLSLLIPRLEDSPWWLALFIVGMFIFVTLFSIYLVISILRGSRRN